MQIEKGSIVEWQLCPDAIEEDPNSLYHEKSRSHVIAFDDINVESPKLELSNEQSYRQNSRSTTFSMSFTDTGKFSYKCLIYTWMKGYIEVLDND